LLPSPHMTALYTPLLPLTDHIQPSFHPRQPIPLETPTRPLHHALPITLMRPRPRTWACWPTRSRTPTAAQRTQTLTRLLLASPMRRLRLSTARPRATPRHQTLVSRMLTLPVLTVATLKRRQTLKAPAVL